MALVMQDQRTRDALARIDRALGRLDAALSADSPPPREVEELARLREAHALLRNRVQTAIGEIDSLLERQPEEAA